MLAVVFTFDQFPMRLLSCYGNFELAMPGLSRMAAESVVFDQHFGEDFSSDPQGHAWWSGCYYFPRAGTEWMSKMPSLPRLLAEGNVQSQWLTDEAEPKMVPLPQDVPLTVVESFRQLMQRGCEVMDEAAAMPDLRQLIWLKTGESIWEESEDAESVMAQIDAELTPLWNRLQALKDSRQVLFLLTSARGMSLGEREVSPGYESTWAEEFVHLPLMVHHAEHPGGERRSVFTQSIDLPATLLDFFAVESNSPCEGESFLPIFRGDETSGRESLTYGGSGSWEAMRTRDCHFVRWEESPHPDQRRRFLFIKPDDPWDWHEVSAQLPELTETLSGQLDAFLQSAKTHLPITRSRASLAGVREGEAPAEPL